MKNDGISSAASALRYWERRQEIAANNLANATTDGFKAERAFARLLNDALPVPDARTDMRDGTLRPTGNPLDVAVHNEGFFVVETAAGQRWTRGGAWQLSPDKRLADADGNYVLGERGPIKIAGGTVEIDRQGYVAVDGRIVDRLLLERPNAGVTLQHDEGTRFLRPTAEQRQAIDVSERDIRQGAIEESNVNSIGTMVDMISIQRNFASAQKVIGVLDDMRATITNDLAKPL
jgi:flagellar basal body rod protein FlgG